MRIDFTGQIVPMPIPSKPTTLRRQRSGELDRKKSREINEFAEDIIHRSTEEADQNGSHARGRKNVYGILESGFSRLSKEQRENSDSSGGKLMDAINNDDAAQTQDSSRPSRKNVYEVLEEIERFEIELMKGHSGEKEGTESIKAEGQVQRTKQIKAVLHALQDAFHGLETQLDDEDPDHPLGSMHTRREVLEAENEVLRIRLQQQEEALKVYQKEKTESECCEEEEGKPVSSDGDPSVDEMRAELQEMRALLAEKDKANAEQALRCNEMQEKIEQLQNQAWSGHEVPILHKRIWELEKEKSNFMLEISRLKQVKQPLEGVIGRKSSGSISVGKECAKVDENDVKAILEEDQHDGGSGFVGWFRVLGGGATNDQL